MWTGRVVLTIVLLTSGSVAFSTDPAPVNEDYRALSRLADGFNKSLETFLIATHGVDTAPALKQAFRVIENGLAYFRGANQSKLKIATDQLADFDTLSILYRDLRQKGPDALHNISISQDPNPSYTQLQNSLHAKETWLELTMRIKKACVATISAVAKHDKKLLSPPLFYEFAAKYKLAGASASPFGAEKALVGASAENPFRTGDIILSVRPRRGKESKITSWLRLSYYLEHNKPQELNCRIRRGNMIREIVCAIDVVK